MSEAKKVKSIVDVILEFVTGGEEANVKSIVRLSNKKWAKQIQLKERAITAIKEKLVETLEEQEELKADELVEYKESFLNVDVDVKGRSNIVYYIDSVYEQQISNAKAVVDARDKKIADMKSAAAVGIEKLEKEIVTYKAFMAELIVK